MGLVRVGAGCHDGHRLRLDWFAEVMLSYPPRCLRRSIMSLAWRVVIAIAPTFLRPAVVCCRLENFPTGRKL